MPKMKTRTSVKKRFKLNSKNKVKRKKAFARHILSKKSSSRVRKMRKAEGLNLTDTKLIKRLLPYG